MAEKSWIADADPSVHNPESLDTNTSESLVSGDEPPRCLDDQLKRHLWDPLRLSKAKDFAAKTTRSLSLSRSISLGQPTEGEVLESCDVEDSNCTVCDNDSCSCEGPDILQSAERSSSPGKANCLNLINRIWKGGLDDNLEQIRQRNLRIMSEGTNEHSEIDCRRCVELKREIMTHVCEAEDKNLSAEAKLSSDESAQAKSCSHAETAIDEGSECSNDRPETPIPFKKARFSWQVKNKSRAEDPEESGSSRGNSLQKPDEKTSIASTHSNIDDTEVDDELIDTNKPPSVETSKKLAPSPSQSEPSGSQQQSTEAHPGSQRRPSSRDFQTLTQALTGLDYVERWQCQHVAKAIVDNAINKTLEEMGLAPDESPPTLPYPEQRSRIEDAGVSQAILARGLRRYSPQSYRMRRLNPIITRLTRVSEHLFSDNLRGILRNRTAAGAATDDEDEDEDEEMEDAVGEFQVPAELRELLQMRGVRSAMAGGANADVNVVESQDDESEGSHMETDPNDLGLAAIEPSLPLSPGSNFVIDQAVDAVILEKGLLI